MSKTKKKIIETTIELFNEHGFANVSLPNISDKLGISLGNLTYHFPKKDQLIEAIYTTFQDDLATITKEYELLSDLGGMDEQLRDFYHFQKRFQFFYLDLLELERAYPDIAKKHYVHIERQIDGLYQSFTHNQSIGNLIEVNSEKTYQHLAHQFWMSIVFWSLQLVVRGKEGTIDDMSETAWQLVLPYATDKGKTDFKNIFNTDKIIE